MGTCYRSSRVEAKGKIVVEAVLDGRVDNFETYAYRTLGNNQRIETRANQIGSSVVKYLQTVDDENFVNEILEKMIKIERSNFIEIFRVAQDLATKLDRYKGNRRMKTSYLLRHPDASSVVFDMALWVAEHLNYSNSLI